jgi:translation initiation factor 2B subunit (eIF-2B alpha/beta/delta family)
MHHRVQIPETQGGEEMTDPYARELIQSLLNLLYQCDWPEGEKFYTKIGQAHDYLKSTEPQEQISDEGKMTDRFLTVVFRNPTPDEAFQLVFHSKFSAGSWSHAMDERDDHHHQLQKLLDKAEEENERRFKECMKLINNLKPGEIQELMGPEFMEEFRRVSQ